VLNSIKARCGTLGAAFFSGASRPAVAVSAALSTALIPSAALAQAAQGVSGLFGNLGTTATNFISLVAIIAVAIGIAAVLYGLVMMIKKGTGRGEDIEWREILWPMIGGSMATVLMFIVYALVAEVGAGANVMGTGWGN